MLFPGNYLGGVRLHITGCEGDERTALRLVCRHGNALVHTSMAPSIRYIVVRASPARAHQALQHC